MLWIADLNKPHVDTFLGEQAGKACAAQGHWGVLCLLLAPEAPGCIASWIVVPTEDDCVPHGRSSEQRSG